MNGSEVVKLTGVEEFRNRISKHVTMHHAGELADAFKYEGIKRYKAIKKLVAKSMRERKEPGYLNNLDRDIDVSVIAARLTFNKKGR